MAKLKKEEVAAIAIGGAIAVGVGIAVAFAQTPPPPPNMGTLVVNSTPNGVNFTVNGVAQTTPFSQSYNDGTSLTITVPASVTVGAQTLSFQNWSDGNANLTRQATIVAGGTLSFTAIYSGGGLMPTTTTIASDLSQAAVGQNITFSGKVTSTGGGVPGVSLDLESSQDQLTWSTMMTVNTDGSGNYTGTGSFSAPGTYFVRANFPGA